MPSFEIYGLIVLFGSFLERHLKKKKPAENTALWESLSNLD